MSKLTELIYIENCKDLIDGLRGKYIGVDFYKNYIYKKLMDQVSILIS